MAGKAFGAVVIPEGPTWSQGTGMATAMIASIPPRGHFAEATISLLENGDYEVKVGTADFGSGTTTVHAQLVATALATSVSRVRILQSDTDLVGYDTGAYGSAGVLVAGKALFTAAQKLAALMVERAGGGTVVEGGVLVGETVVAASALLQGGPLVTSGAHDGTPRTVAFNVHAFRVAVNSATGEVRILQSIQAADAGTVLNPEQLRGQIEGGTAQAIGSALYEELMLDGEGRVLTDAFRNYHIPQFADVPRTEVYFATTHDRLGTLGAKSMSEAPYNPIAPALANAIRDALGLRPHELPMSRDRLWRLAQGR
jgi:CO/xanthine dehydrogenase Mo-binding subunit